MNHNPGTLTLENARLCLELSVILARLYAYDAWQETKERAKSRLLSKKAMRLARYWKAEINRLEVK